ncbi:hypothetical protein CHS0354_024120 [Potamilus streckersoni]|uniref:Glucose/Sorbosone dehydrogenase domain-containing protein n=1 Tax=Potamilus streckersoni TaxID=2493646 RepID=A0AAE0RZN7_9BIVA|nr:hypothetical protein CHS0354_024120 [Potamilus streckersoni]
MFEFESKTEVRCVVIAENLKFPWSVTFLDKDNLLVTERTGGVKFVKNGKAVEVKGLDISVNTAGQGGILDIVKHYDFEKNKQVYLCYSKKSKSDPSLSTTALIRFEFNGTQAMNIQELFEAKPYRKGDLHYGSRIAFDKLGHVFLTVGDRYDYPNASSIPDVLTSTPQNLLNHLGKIVRLNEDGTIPDNNPYTKNPKSLPEIFSYGHRNPQGLFYDHANSILFSNEHGAKGGDEVNKIIGGKNYGWPVVTHGVDYSGRKIGLGNHREGMEPPIYIWNPSIAVSGLCIYNGNKYPNWKENMFTCSLRYGSLIRLVLKNGNIVSEERMLNGEYGRLRDVRQSPDGYLYLLTDEPNENEPDELIAKVFRNMSELEMEHALAFMKKNNFAESQLPIPSWKARTLAKLGKHFGYNIVLDTLMNTEKRLSNSVLNARSMLNSKSALSDTSHVKILKNILNNKLKVSSDNVARFETRHKTVGGNALRAAVLGGNDGLISNFSLVMGVAGATYGQNEIIIAGLAGLLAGSLSMSLGEWISVKSSHELYENQIELELEELETNPEGEEKELALIYMTKGLSEELAIKKAKDVISNKEQAHEILVREELGINIDDMKDSAMEAAVTSFFLFAFGALIPIIPFFFFTGTFAIALSVVLSCLGLYLIGAMITLFTNKSAIYSGLRQMIFGLVAAIITYSIGKLVGISML